MKISTRTLLFTCCLAALASPVLADDDVAAVSDAPAGEDAVVRGVQSPGGMLSIRLTLGMNLSKDLIGKPISLVPNVYYGVSDKLQLGLVHDGPMRMQTPPGAGLCLTGSSNGCPHVYDNIGFDAMYGILFGPGLHLSAHGALYVTSFDLGTTMLAVGATAKVHLTDSMALFADPQLGFQLAKRDVAKDMLYLPVELQYEVSEPATAKLLTGITGSLSGFGDTYQVPVGVGVNYNLNERFDVGGRFSFDNLLGKHATGVGAADSRSVALQLNIRM